MERSLGFKIGAVLSIIGFLYLTQTGLKGFLPIPVVDEYIEGFTMPTIIGPVNLVIIAWIIFISGIACILLAIFDLPPFNY
jgi:hypothetical protein